MEQATEKQIKFAQSLGISNPAQYSKEEIKVMIDEKLKGKKEAKKPESAAEVRHSDIVVTRTDKPHSYEFGRAGNRFKIYFNEINELKLVIEGLKLAGLIIPEDLTTIKPEDFAFGKS